MNKPLKLLRKHLNDNDLDGFIIHRTDEHLGEEIAQYAERVKWLTKFSGSAGIVVVHKNKAAIFVDGRYTLQVKKQVNPNEFTTHHISYFNKWVQNNFSNNSNIGIDPWLFSKKSFDKMLKIKKNNNIIFRFLDKNPIDAIWQDQPSMPKSKVFLHELKYSGKSTYAKITASKKILKERKCNIFFITALDSIAWILNIRGSDLNFSPLNMAYLSLAYKGKANLYIDSRKLNNNIKKYLSKFVNFKNFNELENDIFDLTSKITVGVDANNTPYWFIYKLQKFQKRLKFIEDPCIRMKAVKNKIELNGARKANSRDGISLIKFLYWIKNKKNIKDVNELSAARKLLNLKKNNKLFYSLSFEAISAFGANAALPHYRVDKNSNINFYNNQIYLIDAGTQYLDGTTDITRSIIIGIPSREQVDRFTRVLKGHIAIANLRFAKKTRGSKIDQLARKSLQEIGCDYEHGTGHGIGSFLNVHEGPQRIAKSIDKSDPYIESGMIISNEPGFYKKDAYGIRIENLIVALIEKNKLLRFETISMAPIDLDLVDAKLLDDIERNWLNEYHKKVYYNSIKYLNNNEVKWLKYVTRPI